MPTLDRDRLDAIVNAVVEKLEGDWLLIGGAIAALWFAPRRTTIDVDILGLGGTPGERLALMELADSLGLPVESMNSAADFFVQRIPDWRKELVLFRSGPKARVFRPSTTLFILLKIRRLDERDLEDCIGALGTSDPIDKTRILAALDALPPPADEFASKRRADLRRRIS